MAEITFQPRTNEEKLDSEMIQGEKLITGIPKPPCALGGQVDAPTFFDYLRSIPTEHWSHLVVYIYSEYPIMRASTDRQGTPNIGKAVCSIDADWLLYNYGSGSYALTLNDTNLPKAKKQTVLMVPKSKPFVLRNEAFPPKRELEKVSLTDPANKDYVSRLKRDGLLTTDGNPMNPGNDPASIQNAATINKVVERMLDGMNKKTEPSAEIPVMMKVMDMARDSSQQTTQILMQQLKEKDPDAFIRMLTAMKDLQPPPTPIPDNSKMFELLLATQAKSAESTNQILMKMMEIQASNNANKGNSIAEFMTILTTAKDLFAADKGGDTWPGVVKESIGMLFNPDVVGGIGGIISAVKSRPGEPIQPQPNQAQNGKPGMTKEQQQLMQFLPMVKFPLMKFVNEGRPGFEFAGWIFDSYGQTAIDSISALGKDAIMQVLMQDPQLSQLPRLEGFIDEFLSPPPPESDSDEDERPARIVERKREG